MSMEFKNLREEQAVDAIIEQLKKGNFRKATIRLGELRGTPQEFMDLFKFLTKNSRLEDADLKIKSIPAKVKCLSCDWKGDPEIKKNEVRCPRCFRDVEILSGHELRIDL
jgi:hydrogenase nickel incorporation protein HypA/HybF